MKKIILSIILFSSINFAEAQDKKVIFSTNEIVWYGLDFNKAKFIGTFDQFGTLGNATGADMKTNFIPKWIEYFTSEQTESDLKTAFQKSNNISDLEPLKAVNEKVDAAQCMSFSLNKLDRAAIDAEVKSYPAGEKKEGIGCSFIIENFNKTSKVASVYVTFFDVKTHKVLFTKKMEGNCIGIGIYEYWKGAITDIIKQITESQWKNWKRT
jgi:hypothetical protein